MLQELIRVDDIKFGLGILQVVDIAVDECDIVDRFLRRVRSRVFEHSRSRIKAYDLAR